MFIGIFFLKYGIPFAYGWVSAQCCKWSSADKRSFLEFASYKTSYLMKKIILIAAALLLGFLISLAAPDYSGNWTGYITQKSAMALSSNYHFSLRLQDTDGEITGHSEIRMWDEQNVFGVMELVGSYNEDELDLKETEIVREQIFSYAYWCLKSMHMYYTVENGKEILRGHWNSDVCTGPGEIYLEREAAI